MRSRHRVHGRSFQSLNEFQLSKPGNKGAKDKTLLLDVSPTHNERFHFESSVLQHEESMSGLLHSPFPLTEESVLVIGTRREQKGES